MQQELKQEKNILGSLIFLMALVGYPIFAGISVFLGVESSLLLITYRFIVLVAAITLFLTSLLGKSIRINYKILIGASFFFYYSIRMFLEWITNYQESKFDWDDFWIFLLFVSFIPALPYLWKKNIPNDDLTPRAIILFGMVGLILNFYVSSHSYSSDFVIWERLFSGRLENEKLNPISYGHLGVSTAVVGLWLLMIRKDISLLSLMGVIVGILGVLASGSRGPFLSLFVCIVLICFKMKFRLIKFVVIFLLLLPFVIAIFDFKNIYIFSRVESSMFEDDGRMGLLRDAYDIFLNNIFFGAGYIFESYPHNIIMEAFMSSGIIGGILMVFTLILGVVASKKILNFNDKSSWMSLLFIQNFIFSMVSSSIFYSSTLWMLWVCMIGQENEKN